MNNFIYENKTKVYFGKGGVKEYLGSLLGNYGETVMLAYGGGSIKRNGVYDEVMGILNAAGKRAVEFSGIMSNPTYAKVQEGAKLARENHVGLILAVGGGSVSDCCKVISAQANLDEDIWEMQYTKHTLPTKFIPLGTIVTVFGTGGEMSNGAARFARFTRSVCGIASKGSDEKTALAGIDALAAFIREIGLPTSFAELGIPADTDFRAIADSTNITAGCCKKLTRDEIYEILRSACNIWYFRDGRASLFFGFSASCIWRGA